MPFPSNKKPQISRQMLTQKRTAPTDTPPPPPLPQIHLENECLWAAKPRRRLWPLRWAWRRATIGTERWAPRSSWSSSSGRRVSRRRRPARGRQLRAAGGATSWTPWARQPAGRAPARAPPRGRTAPPAGAPCPARRWRRGPCRTPWT
uniref:Uncharacterized protein n=1 Tax=Arundo donax TaxID=35708 RepID=A0A0A9EV23_ARUDO